MHPVRLLFAALCLMQIFELEVSAAPTRRPEERGSRIGDISFDDSTPIRVLLTQSITKVKVSGITSIESAGHTRKTRQEGSLEFETRKNGVHAIQRPTATRDYFERDLTGPVTLSGSLQVDGTPYRGSLQIASRGKNLMLVNTLSLGDYLAGTVGSEMPSSWPAAALRAQAVAARSYALAQKLARRSERYDVESTILDQVYRGRRSEGPAVAEAVRETAGQFLIQRGGSQQPARAQYHARCGGFGEVAENVWGSKQGGTQKIPCPFCQTHQYRWSARIPREEIARLLGLPFRALADLHITPDTLTPGGRLKALRVVAARTLHSLPAEKLRSLLGYARIQSTRFRLSQQGKDLVFEGAGAGHGVGLCQWGAQGLARDGWDYRKILAHYYPSHALTSATSDGKPSQRMVDGPRDAKPSRTRILSAPREHRQTSGRT